MEIKGNEEGCFSRKNIEELVNSHFQPEDELTLYLNIRQIIVNDTKCIGLYQCVFTGLASNEIVLKVLKFEKKTYMFPSENSAQNEKILNEFITKYNNSFSKDDLEILIYQFRKGTEYRGSFFKSQKENIIIIE